MFPLQQLNSSLGNVAMRVGSVERTLTHLMTTYGLETASNPGATLTSGAPHGDQLSRDQDTDSHMNPGEVHN